MVTWQPTPRAGACALVLLAFSIADGRSAELTASRAGMTREQPSLASRTASPSSDADGERAAPARRPFEGFWAANRAACLNPDSDERMAITTDWIDWYETRCRIGTVTPAGRDAWHLDLACRGEGQRIRARATASLPTVDTLTIDDGPIGPSKRQRYLRCKPR